MQNSNTNRRRNLCLALLVLPLSGLPACQAREAEAQNRGQKVNKDDKELMYFDVSTFDYLDRPVFEIRLNGVEVGSGGGALMTGVRVPTGPQVVTWRLGGPEGMAGNGNTVKASNQPTLTRPEAKFKYLGVHIYPDNTVELIPELYWPEKTARGEEINRRLETNRGK